MFVVTNRIKRGRASLQHMALCKLVGVISVITTTQDADQIKVGWIKIAVKRLIRIQRIEKYDFVIQVLRNLSKHLNL